jgi:hypothetical protein
MIVHGKIVTVKLFAFNLFIHHIFQVQKKKKLSFRFYNVWVLLNGLKNIIDFKLYYRNGVLDSKY